MTRKAKGWIIAGSIVGGAYILFAGFLVYAFTHFGRAGGVEQIKANRIGSRTYLNERSVVINKHKFIYYNVISSRDGEWILVDKSSYIINTDWAFGFRYKNAGTIITSYGDAQEPRDMGPYYGNEAYNSYQVYGGFKITIDELQDLDHLNLGIFEHWC